MISETFAPPFWPNLNERLIISFTLALLSFLSPAHALDISRPGIDTGDDTMVCNANIRCPTESCEMYGSTTGCAAYSTRYYGNTLLVAQGGMGVTNCTSCNSGYELGSIQYASTFGCSNSISFRGCELSCSTSKSCSSDFSGYSGTYNECTQNQSSQCYKSCSVTCSGNATSSCPANATCTYNTSYTYTGTQYYGGSCSATAGTCPVSSFTCNAGYYKNSAGTACVKCESGYYCTGNNTRTACSNKPSNSSYTSATGNTSSSCPWSCNAGYYGSSANGNTSCAACGSGNFCTGGTHRQSCASIVPSSAPTPSEITSLSSGSWSDYTHGASASDCICNWYFSDSTRVQYLNQSGCSGGPAGNNYTAYSWCRTGYYAADPLGWNNWYTSCKACTNGPANSYYTSYSTPSTMYAVESNCPWSCNANYYKSGSSCAACSSVSFTDKETITNGSRSRTCYRTTSSAGSTSSSACSGSGNCGSWSYSCNSGYHEENGACVPDCSTSKSCSSDFSGYSGTYNECTQNQSSACYKSCSVNCSGNATSSCPANATCTYNTSYTYTGTQYYGKSCGATAGTCPPSGFTCNAGYYLSNGACVICPAGSYCPGDNKYYTCPDPVQYAPTSLPANYYSSSVESASVVSGTGLSSAGQCNALIWYTNVRGGFYEYAYYNTSTGRYNANSPQGWHRVNPGYYLKDRAGCGSYAYYYNAEVCPAGSYCPGKDYVVCNSSNQATVHTATYGLNSCPSGYPNSGTGSDAITDCYSNTKSRAWSGSQTACSKPSGCATVSCNTCSGSACDYVAYSNSAGNGDGTIKSGCSSNSAACQQTVKSVTASANYYVDGTSCPACPSGYPKSDGGNISSSKCFVVKTNTGTQTACSTPTNCASSTCGTCTPGTCDWRDYNGATDESCTPTNCQKPVASVTAKANYYVHGVTCPSCSSADNGTYVYSDGGDISWALCYKNATLTGAQTPCSQPTNSASYTCGTCTPSECSYKDYAGTTDTVCTPNNCEQPVASVVCNTGYYTDGTTCPACTNKPSNSTYTGTATSNSCPWSCNSGYNQTYDNQCAQMCGAGITHLKLSSGVSIPLYSVARTAPAINVKWNNTVCYGSLVTGTGSGLNIKTPDGKTYHAVN